MDDSMDNKAPLPPLPIPVRPDESVAEPLEQDHEHSRNLGEIAREVVAGKWGLGVDRRQRLVEAGFDPNAVKKEIVRIMNEKP